MSIESKPKGKSAPHGRGRRARHRTVNAVDFLNEGIATTGHNKADDLGAKLGGNAPEIVLTLAHETERANKMAPKVARAQGPSARADDAAAPAGLASAEGTS
jgi:hypothetical protein